MKKKLRPIKLSISQSIKKKIKTIRRFISSSIKKNLMPIMLIICQHIAKLIKPLNILKLFIYEAVPPQLVGICASSAAPVTVLMPQFQNVLP